MGRSLEFARQMVDVSSGIVARLLLDYPPEHPRVRDAKESAAGWKREVERLEWSLAAGEEQTVRATLGSGALHGEPTPVRPVSPAASDREEEA